MKKLAFCSLLIMAFFLSSCVMRTIPRKVDRVDQEINGNRGVIFGKVPPVEKSKAKKTKTVYDVEIELASPLDVQKPQQKDNAGQARVSKPAQNTNKDYMGKTQKSSIIQPISSDKKETLTLMGGASAPQEIIYTKPGEPSSKKGPVSEKKKNESYVVLKGDTLQKISEKFYGTTKKWKMIYEVNKETLHSPDKIKPGQKLIIPLD